MDTRRGPGNQKHLSGWERRVVDAMIMIICDGSGIHVMVFQLLHPILRTRRPLLIPPERSQTPLSYLVLRTVYSVHLSNTTPANEPDTTAR